MHTKRAGPTKTTVQATMWTYFLLKEEGEERIKVSSIFVTDMTGNLVEHTFSCLTDIVFSSLRRKVELCFHLSTRQVRGKRFFVQLICAVPVSYTHLTLPTSDLV